MNVSNSVKISNIMQKSANLFNFSKIKSENIFRTSDCNSFNYNFSYHELKNTGFKKISNQKKKISKNYIKKVDMNIPSNKKLKEEKFRRDFFIDYENSFANFCGINEKMFQEIYEKNDYIPTLNQMGDIKIDISNIIKNINKFSHSKKLRIRRLLGNPNKKIKIKIKDIFEESSSNNKSKKIFEILKVKKNNNDKKYNDGTKSIESNSTNSLESVINKDNNQKDKTFLNIKRKMKHISIDEDNRNSINDLFSPKNQKFNDYLLEDLVDEFLTLSDNNSSYPNFDNNEYGLILSSYNNKNNFSNFSSQEFQNPDNKAEEINNCDISPYKSILSPVYFNHDKVNSKVSGNFSICSPYNIDIFNQIFNFNNNYIINDDDEKHKMEIFGINDNNEIKAIN